MDEKTLIIERDTENRIVNSQQLVKEVLSTNSQASCELVDQTIIDIDKLAMNINCRGLFEVQSTDSRAAEHADIIRNGSYIIDGDKVDTIDLYQFKSQPSTPYSSQLNQQVREINSLQDFIEENSDLKLTENQTAVLQYLLLYGSESPTVIGRVIAGKPSNWACGVLGSLRNKYFRGMPLVDKHIDTFDNTVAYYSPLKRELQV